MIERQELYCHNCSNYVQFNLDMELEGQHELTCPKCGHKHYRIIQKGEITEARWGQDPSQKYNYQVTGNITYTSGSTYSTCSSSSSFLYNSWLGTGVTA